MAPGTTRTPVSMEPPAESMGHTEGQALVHAITQAQALTRVALLLMGHMARAAPPRLTTPARATMRRLVRAQVFTAVGDRRK